MTVTAPPGFVAAGVSAGIKGEDALDLALVATVDREPVAAAATFTTNRAAAAPVRVSREHLQTSGGRAGAVLLSSGNANAATGRGGLETAEGACGLVAEALGIAPASVLVCATGLIGVPLPLAPFRSGVPLAVAALEATPEAGALAAEAIRTTDTRAKTTLARGAGFVVGGMAKGAAMLAPAMATMLAVLTTDAAVSPEVLASALRAAVDRSFNELSVDGCCSTNDTVVALANGRGASVEPTALERALTEACEDLAAQMADDAEGATKVAEIVVCGALDDAEAARGARRVAESQLVQASLHGADPYWGRIVSELGAAGIGFELERVRVSYGGVAVCERGEAKGHDAGAVAAHLAGRHIRIEAHLGLGEGSARVRTTDLSAAYVELNATTS